MYRPGRKKTAYDRFMTTDMSQWDPQNLISTNDESLAKIQEISWKRIVLDAHTDSSMDRGTQNIQLPVTTSQLAEA